MACEADPKEQPRMKPAILYIGPSMSWKPLLHAIRGLDHAAIACIAEDFHGGPINAFLPFDELRKPDGPKKLGFDAMIDHREPYRILEQVRTLEDVLSLRVVGLLRASEADTAVIDFVAAGLGVPHNPISSLLARRDKAAMKEAVGAAGLQHAAFCRITHASQVADSMTRLDLELPLVVKTPACASSSDVFVCKSAERVVQRVEELLSKNSPWGERPSYVLLEEFLDGPEYAVNTFANGKGQSVVTDMWSYEREESSQGNVLYRSIRSVDPAEFPEACAYALDVCNAVGILMEAGHVELKMTKRGPVMVEVGARRPGGRKTEMLESMVPRWNPYAAQVLTCCGTPPSLDIDFSPVKHVRHVFLPTVEAGIVTSIRGEGEIKALKSYHSLSVMAQVGEFVKETTDIVSCAGFIWLVDASQQQLDEDEHLVRSLFNIEMEGDHEEPAKRARRQ